MFIGEKQVIQLMCYDGTGADGKLLVSVSSPGCVVCWWQKGWYFLTWVFTFDQIQIMGECDTQSLDLGHVLIGSCDRLNEGLNLKHTNYSAVTFHSESRLLRGVIHQQTLFL